MTWWAPASSVLNSGPSEAGGRGWLPPQIPILKVSERNLFYQKNFYFYLPPQIFRPSTPLMIQPIMAGEACLFFVFQKWMNFRLHASFSPRFYFLRDTNSQDYILWRFNELPKIFSRDHLLQEFFKDCEKIGILIGVLEEFWLEKLCN